MEQRYRQEKNLKNAAIERLNKITRELRILEEEDSALAWKERCRKVFEFCRELQGQHGSLLA